jgi:carboxypeptidase PM20D1
VKKLLKALGLVLLLLMGVLLVRALLFTPEESVKVDLFSVVVNEAQITAHMVEAIRFKTVSTGDADTQDYVPFPKFVEWVANTYPGIQQAMELTMFGQYTMLYKWQGEQASLKPVLLTAHYDVVPVVPGSEDNWQHPPFSGAIADGYVWGRGTLDDKSAVVVMLEAATQLIDEGFVPQRTIYFSFSHDEEVGGPNGAANVVRYFKSNNVQLAWSLDEGSFLSSDMLPGFDKPIASINVAEKGSLTLEIVASSAGGHSSLPEAEVSVDILAQALVRLRQHPLPGEIEGIAAEMFETVAKEGSFIARFLMANKWLFGGMMNTQLSKNSYSNALIRTTTAPTMLRAGIKSNVIPPSASATVNFRLHPRDTPDSVLAHVVAAIDDDRVAVQLKNDGMYTLASSVSSRDSEGYKAIAHVARQIFGDIIVVPGLTIAGTDSKHYLKVADDSYRFQYMMLTKEDSAGFHGTNERISIENLVQATQAYYLLMKQAMGE